MNRLYVGIDVGGTHTDGVAVDIDAGRIVHKVKVPTTPDLGDCSMAALEDILETVSADSIGRVLLSTTLATNAVATGLLEPAGLIILPGPGMNPSFLTSSQDSYAVRGAVDHRGREIAPIDEEEIIRICESLSFKGISVVAIAGKFAGRNPTQELKVAELAERYFDHVSLAHRLSGALNFPRRVATAFLAASLWRRQKGFIEAMAESVRKHGITAPLFLLRADGGAGLAASVDNAAQTALSGPAASIMGALAMNGHDEETVTLDVGGTTTDISLILRGVPLLEPHGATIGEYKTQIRSLFNRSVAIGGDSEVVFASGRLLVGPMRRGPAACYGGPAATPTDAMVLLGRAAGDEALAENALRPLAQKMEVSTETCAMRILEETGKLISEAVRDFVSEVNRRPVYTIYELLEGHKVNPQRALLVGGPGRALAPYLEARLKVPVHVPGHYDVANAIGAAVAGVTFEVNASADTARGVLSIPEAGIYRKVNRGYTIGEMEAECESALRQLAEGSGIKLQAFVPEAVERESFNIIEDYQRAGSIHRLRVQVRPSILCKVE
jgi:N-methylhydantoinase A/oxoprolinase/acetone carboxylase beta subunit